jgi:signal transduction histidine kinase
VVPAGGVDLSDARAIAGDVAAEVTHELADPVRALRDRLGLVVDHLERHVALSTGPTPYPWKQLQTLRQDLAAAYLEATQLARRLDELARAVAPEAGADWFDAGAAVDLGLRLAAHHVARDVELLFDLGEPPPARGAAGTLALLVAQLVAVCAVSARSRPGSALSVRVAAAPEPGWVAISIADNGDGNADAERLGELARGVVASWGATVDAASDPGRGCAFELRLITKP